MLKRRIEDYGLTATINTTEDCNLRCKYCYEINKRKKSIKFEYAKKFIDCLLEDPDPIGISKDSDSVFNDRIYKSGLLLDFIGGDALMDVDILDKIFTYFTKKLWTTNTPNAIYWRSHHRFTISSNGTLFTDKKVQDFLLKWNKNISISVSLDGCPAIHDKNRIMLKRGLNGEELGSMKYILDGWGWFQRYFSDSATSTKATCSKDSIPYLHDSIKYLYEEMGITNINMNFVMENQNYTDEDYKELDRQFRKCIPYMLEHRHDFYWGLIDYDQFAKHKPSKGLDWTERGHCGSGGMPCLGINGNIYPCFRWTPHTQAKDNSEPIIVGDVNRGFYNKDGFTKVRKGAYRVNCTKEEKCKTCIYEGSCPYCIGGCYAEFQDFIRTTYICEIIKLQCKWAKVYWNEYNKLEGLPMEFDEFFQLDRIPNWTKPISTTNEKEM